MVVEMSLVMMLFALQGQLPPAPAASAPITPAVLAADLTRLVRLVDSVHPWPWRRTTADAFHREARRLSASIKTLSSEQAVVRMMRLVATLHDGHTTLYPAGRVGFDAWFPVRFSRFADSLAITAIDSSSAHLAGATVLRLGGAEPLAAASQVAQLTGADNPSGERQLTGLLSNAATLHALGFSDGNTLTLDVRTSNGRVEHVQLRARRTEWGDPAWMQRGEMFGPPGIPVMTAFSRRAPLDYRRQSSALPLHLRNRIPIWFTWLPEDSTLYVQSNFVQDYNGTQFASVVDSIFAVADARPVRRLVLDLRFNSGGDGSKLMPFVHEMIRRPRLDQPGHFVVLIGGKTFSAAVLWLSLLREHTTVTTIGDAAGAPRNHSGDASTFVLPGTGMLLQVSTLRHYGTRSDDTSRTELPDFPVAMTAGGYFHGNDAALSLARSHDDLRHLPDIAVADGTERMLAELSRRRAMYGQLPDWTPFGERDMNSAAYQLLGRGKVADAVAAFRVNTVEYPGSSNVWDSYGEALLAHGDTVSAVVSYHRAAALDPGNTAAREIVKRLGRP